MQTKLEKRRRKGLEGVTYSFLIWESFSKSSISLSYSSFQWESKDIYKITNYWQKNMGDWFIEPFTILLFGFLILDTIGNPNMDSVLFIFELRRQNYWLSAYEVTNMQYLLYLTIFSLISSQCEGLSLLSTHL